MHMEASVGLDDAVKMAMGSIIGLRDRLVGQGKPGNQLAGAFLARCAS
jgi:hypothetical protein